MPTGNPQRATVKLEVEPRLNNPIYTGFSTTGWYLLAGPAAAVMIVGFLDGRQTPIVEEVGLQATPNKLELGWRIYHDYGAKLGDFRAGVRAAGV